MIPGSDYLVTGIFVLVVATTVGGALLAVLSTRIIRSVCGLALCCVGLAGLYYFLNSPFLALMEILIYVGAVCVTIIFGVMLSETDEPEPQEKRNREAWWGGVALLVSAARRTCQCPDSSAMADRRWSANSTVICSPGSA